MTIPPQLENFQDLEKFLREESKESKLSYKAAILEYYKNLGENLGFEVREDFSVIKHAINLGKLDLLWVEPNITFTIEFSSLENLLKELVKIVEFSPSLSVLILSSKSSCKVRDVKKFMAESNLFQAFREKFLILDLAEKKVITFS
jgi:hypothetical protein